MNPVLDAYAALGEALDGVRKAMDEHAHLVGDGPRPAMPSSCASCTNGSTTSSIPKACSTARRPPSGGACDANLYSLHVDGNGVPLELGRIERFASPGQWLALVARDGGCVGPNCTRPPEWTQAHYIDWWEHLGPTDLENLCLVCALHMKIGHHDQVHHGGWAIAMASDGHPEFVPPEPVDPHRQPIRNTHWHAERGERAA